MRAFGAGHKDGHKAKTREENFSSRSQSLNLTLQVSSVCNKWNLKERIATAASLPFTAWETAENFPEYVAQYVSMVWYLTKRYSRHFVNPSLFNHHLHFAIHHGLQSVETIFRDCFDHFPLTKEKVEELEELRQGHEASSYSQYKMPWHWPLPDLSSETVPFLPPKLPRPDKHTFLKAMAFAHSKRLVPFAREVWALRQAWRQQIGEEARKDIETWQWSSVMDEDIIRYEQRVVRGGTRFSATRERWESEDILYEGFIRKLYIEVLAKEEFFDEAMSMILEGTGERRPWNQKILAEVKKVALRHRHKGLCDYINGLEEGEEETEIEEDSWEDSTGD
jgi:hypothetical protein